MDQAWEKAWPFWKFGFKYNDLTTTLHDKYNTISSPIQDPDAFHHDVYEISSRADTLADFERCMQERKALRIKELNGMLEDASFEIVGNPDLIGTEQWALAVQLFRTRSLDSLVRYFASYLPADHPWHIEESSPVESSESEAPSPIDYDGPILFDEPEVDCVLYTNQPSECSSMADAVPANDHPVRSMSMRSEDSGVSVGEQFRRSRKTSSHRRAPARTMSGLDSEPDRVNSSLQNSMSLSDEVASSVSYPETPSTSISDLSDYDDQDRREDAIATAVLDECVVDGYVSVANDIDASSIMDSDVPTPKAEVLPSFVASASSYLHSKPSPLRNHGSTTSRSHPHHAHHTCTDQPRPGHLVAARRLRRREDSLDREVLGSRHVGKAHRARRATPDGVRFRTRPRRRHMNQET